MIPRMTSAGSYRVSGRRRPLALGDSYVSGEGNPDSNARYEDGLFVERPRWSDKQCHRSRASWAMQAARRFEDSNTSVTFLSFACSGAVVDDLLSGGYRGIQPISGGRDKRLVAQIGAARDALGRRCRGRRGRFTRC